MTMIFSFIFENCCFIKVLSPTISLSCFFRRPCSNLNWPFSQSRHRNRNIIWFNPPYNECITSNISRDFLNLISKHFPNNSPLAKIFNKNNIKVSYSCTNNMSQIIKNTTKKSHPPTVQHTPPTNAIVGSKAYASYQKNASIKTRYAKPW